jgi:hypothetical protein
MVYHTFLWTSEFAPAYEFLLLHFKVYMILIQFKYAAHIILYCNYHIGITLYNTYYSYCYMTSSALYILYR